jgi:hypothetical protein
MPERPRAEYFLDGGYAASPAQTGIDDHQVRVLADGGNHRLGLTGRCCAHVVPHACEQLGIATQRAESVGERVGDAYATTDEVKVGSRNAAGRAASQARRAAQQPFTVVAAGFALGYAAALLIYRRQ